MSNEYRLFSEDDWPTVAARQRSRIEEEISTLNGDRLLNTSIDDLTKYFIEKYTFTVPVLQREQIVVEQREAQVDVSKLRDRYAPDRARPFMVTGTIIEVAVPFDGEPEYFKIQPTTISFNLPTGEIQEHSLILSFEGVNLLFDTIRSQVQETLNDITQNLQYLRTDCERFNGMLYTYTHDLVIQRRRKTLSDRSIAYALEYTLREHKPDAESDLSPESRQRIVPTLPAASSVAYQPEPILAIKDFGRILETLQNIARSIKQSPSAYFHMDDNALLAHFVIRLNRYFEGEQPGETFLYAPQGSMVIRSEGKCIFIAACRYWRDANALHHALDEFLDMESWRNTKAVLILFNRTEEFPHVLESMRETVKHHSNFKRELPQLSDAAFPFVLAHQDDHNREMLLTVLLYDAPKQPQS